MPGKEQGIFLQTENKKTALSSRSEIAGVNALLRKGDSFVLGIYKTLSLQEFSYPFSDTLQIREALNLKILPFSSASGGIEVFPTITSRDGKSANGVAWFVSRDELDKFENSGSRKGGRNIYLPLPVIFSSMFDNSGVGIWADSENICAMIFRDGGVPAFYGWKSRNKTTPDEYFSWLVDLAGSSGIEINDKLIIDSEKDPEYSDKIIEMLLKFTEGSSLSGEVNLSRSELDTELYIERLFRIAGKMAMLFIVTGAILLGTSIFRYYTFASTTDWLDERSEQIYREVFDPSGRIVDPLSQAKGKIRALTTEDSGMKIDKILGILGRSSDELGKSKITLDVLRYNGDNIDINGSTMDMTSVQKFQEILRKHGIEPQIGDIQQIPGGGLRFTMAIGW